jgi:hypothetical protein
MLSPSILILIPILFSFAPTTLAGKHRPKCLCDETAEKVALNFQHMFEDYTPEFVDTVLAQDFTDQTDSVAWLISNGTDCPKQVRLLPPA